MPELPDGSEHKAYGALLSMIKQDHDRWHRAAEEITRRAAVMGADDAAASVLDDVRHSRL